VFTRGGWAAFIKSKMVETLIDDGHDVLDHCGAPPPGGKDSVMIQHATPYVIIVIPCYNEADRLAVEPLVGFQLLRHRVELLFVNDGSRDGTLQVLEAMRMRAPRRIGVVSLIRNCGKAEAVRQGVVQALKSCPGLRRPSQDTAHLSSKVATAQGSMSGEQQPIPHCQCHEEVTLVRPVKAFERPVSASHSVRGIRARAIWNRSFRDT